ncbi:MAG TPA: AtzG-like protein [Casimicrobiaceae bacterium]
MSAGSGALTGSTGWQATALAATDNVAIVLAPVSAGDEVAIEMNGELVTITAREPIALGHKIALVDLREGDALTKYGECIGEATRPIARGAWVHVHNLRSRRGRDEHSSDFDPYAYLDAAASAVALTVPPASRDAVAANLARLHALARDVLAPDE